MKCPKIQITFTPEMLSELKDYAEKTGNTVSAIIRILVADFLEEKKKKLSI